MALEEPAAPNLTGQVVSLMDQCLAFLAAFTHCFDSLEVPPHPLT